MDITKELGRLDHRIDNEVDRVRVEKKLALAIPKSENNILAMMSRAHDHLAQRLDSYDNRFNNIDERFGRIDERLDKLETRFDELEPRFNQMDNKLDQLTVIVGKLEAKLL